MANFAKEVKDRDNYHCVKCGYEPSDSSSLHAHHILPQALGGGDEIENGATLCATCHSFAPDYHTAIDNESYSEVFEHYCRTWNPPQMDLFWFGLMASENEITHSDELRKNTLVQLLPNLSAPNWWIYCAAIADYKNIRDSMPIQWSKEGLGVQTELTMTEL